MVAEETSGAPRSTLGARHSYLTLNLQIFGEGSGRRDLDKFLILQLSTSYTHLWPSCNGMAFGVTSKSSRCQSAADGRRIPPVKDEGACVL